MTTADRVKHLVFEHLTMRLDQVQPEYTLRGDLGAHSFEINEMAAEIMADFNITITDAEMAAALTVGDLVKLVEGKI